MSQRVLLGACALGLTLLAGCIIVPGDPPSDPPPTWPPPPPPVDPPPPPALANAPGDEFDPVGYRVLVSDCTNQTILSLDLFTGERSVLVDTWPWPEAGSITCVKDIVVEPYKGIAYATVDRSFPDPDGRDLSCFASDFVSIDPWTGLVTPLLNFGYVCCDDCGNADEFYSPQVDAAHERLLYLQAECSPDACDFFLTSTPFGTQDALPVHGLYPAACYPDDPDCSDYSYISPNSFTFDPLKPDERVLMLATRSDSLKTHIDSLDLATGELIEGPAIQTDWAGDIEVDHVIDFSVDGTGLVLVTAGGSKSGAAWRWLVLGYDVHTGEQSLLYDGSPTADGSALSCAPNPAYDYLTRRLLLIEPPGGYGCTGATFAYDVNSDVFSRL